jgi:ureidoglycolate lyase
MQPIDIVVEPATPEAIAPFGRYLGSAPGVPVYASWPGAKIEGSFPIVVGEGGEMLLCTLDARSFPVQCRLMERHFKHTQTFVPFNGRPFVMVLGAGSDSATPDPGTLRAFLFTDAGIVLNEGVWHDFPYPVEDATRFAVVLREEAHVNLDPSPAYPMDADGPDLQRREIAPRAQVHVHLSTPI